MSIKGGCLCKKLKYEIVGLIQNAVNCHCPMCRKAQGTAFTSNGTVKKNEFKWISSTESLKSYESSPGKHRYFCSECGSPIYKYAEDIPDFYRVRLGSIDDDLTVRPAAHIHVIGKANWYEITDDLPQYEGSASEGKLIIE